MKLISWNVNGIRACLKKGFVDFFESIDADIFCLQETKMQTNFDEEKKSKKEEKAQEEVNEILNLNIFKNYYCYWNSAEKKGYSGTAIFTKKEPLNISYGIGILEHDKEGRVITLEYENFYLVTIYTPNSKRGLERLEYRQVWEDEIRKYLSNLAKKKSVIMCGDLNVAHNEIDLKNPKANRKNAGFSAIKMNATEELQMIDSYDKIDAVLERVAAIRESCGKYFGIAIDFHGRVHKPMAKILAKKLEEFDPMFIEEPVLCENMEVFKEIAVACNIPIATGERLFTKYDFKRLLQAGGVDIIQPDLSHAGGLTEVKKIASMAEAYDVALAPHCPLGPIALAACLNVDATCYNAVIQEQSIGIHYNVGKSVLDYALNKQDFQFVDGFCAMPTKPGLGIEVNKELVLEENLTKHQWKNPIWRHADGSVAEW